MMEQMSKACKLALAVFMRISNRRRRVVTGFRAGDLG